MAHAKTTERFVSALLWFPSQPLGGSFIDLLFVILDERELSMT